MVEEDPLDGVHVRGEREASRDPLGTIGTERRPGDSPIQQRLELVCPEAW
jgi:hypothetical protein